MYVLIFDLKALSSKHLRKLTDMKFYILGLFQTSCYCRAKLARL